MAPDSEALLEISTMFVRGVPAATPQQAAHALAMVEYVSGALSTSARYDEYGPVPQILMLQARGEMRGVLGVAPGTPSQSLVDSLLAVSHAPGDAALRAALAVPVFTRGVDPTLAILRHLPDMPVTRDGVRSIHHTQRFGDGEGGGNTIRVR